MDAEFSAGSTYVGATRLDTIGGGEFWLGDDGGEFGWSWLFVEVAVIVVIEGVELIAIVIGGVAVVIEGVELIVVIIGGVELKGGGLESETVGGVVFPEFELPKDGCDPAFATGACATTVLESEAFGVKLGVRAPNARLFSTCMSLLDWPVRTQQK